MCDTYFDIGLNIDITFQISMHPTNFSVPQALGFSSMTSNPVPEDRSPQQFNSAGQNQENHPQFQHLVPQELGSSSMTLNSVPGDLVPQQVNPGAHNLEIPPPFQHSSHQQCYFFPQSSNFQPNMIQVPFNNNSLHGTTYYYSLPSFPQQ